jgi:O-antigen/teichoic acid export membrane protein
VTSEHSAAVTAPVAGEEKAKKGTFASDSLILLASQISNNSGYFVAVLILARGLGPTGRGTIAFITVTALMTGKLSKLGLSQTTAVFAAQRPAERRELLSNLLLFSAVTAACGGALVAAALLVTDAAPAGVGDAQLALIVAGAVAASLWDESFLLGCGRLRQLSVRTATGGWIYALLLGLVWSIHGLTVGSAAVAWVLGQAMVAALLHWAPLREFGLVRPSPGLLRRSVRFGLRAWPGTVSSVLNVRFDQILMGLISTEAALGIYAVAVNASELLLYLPTVIAMTLLPRIAREDPAAGVERALPAFRAAVLFGAVSIAVAAAVGPLLLPLIFGDAFQPSVSPFLLMLPAVIGYSAMSIFTNALLASSSPGLSSLGPIVSLAVGTALDFALIPAHGASGAAVATTVAFAAAGVTSLLLYRRQAGFAWGSLVPGRSDVGTLWHLSGVLLRTALRRG